MDAPEGIDAMADALDGPLFVVTVAAGGERSGCLVGFVTPCSLEPVRYLVCVSKVNHTFGVAARADALALHLLGRDQHDLAAVFGALTGDATDKFVGVPWHEGETGAPVLDGCAAWMEARIVDRFDLGDHQGLLVDPVAGGSGGHAGRLPTSAAADVEAGHPA